MTSSRPESLFLPEAVAARRYKLLKLEQSSWPSFPEERLGQLRLRLEAMDILWGADDTQPAAAANMFEILQAMPDDELLTRACRLKNDLLHYFVEIDRQRRSFDPAVAVWSKLASQIDGLSLCQPALAAGVENIGLQVGRMCNLFAQCIDVPLYILQALDKILPDIPPTCGGSMPGYHLDRPREALPLDARAAAEEPLAAASLLPIGFDERTACATAGHTTTLAAKKALQQVQSGEACKKITHDLYIIDACFITLKHDFHLKRCNP